MLIMGVIETAVGAVVAPVVSAIGGFVYKNRNQAEENAEEIRNMKQLLLGYEEDDTDEGAIKEIKDQIEELDRKIDRIDSKLDNNGNVRNHTDLSNFEPDDE